jgi:hypothetical protein
VVCGTDLLVATVFCVDEQGLPNLDARLPRLQLEPDRLRFVAYTNGPMQPAKLIRVLNPSASAGQA